jgi:hypothetical protein
MKIEWLNSLLVYFLAFLAGTLRHNQWAVYAAALWWLGHAGPAPDCEAVKFVLGLALCHAEAAFQVGGDNKRMKGMCIYWTMV